MCPFYDSSESGYYCEVKGGDVGWDIYNRYCNTFSSYADCPFYK